MCSFASISVWPARATISTNSIFVIEGYGASQALIRQLNKKNRIYLISGPEIVEIAVVRILEGQFRLTQALLKPRRELTPGKSYQLKIDSLEGFDKSAYKVSTWTVKAQADKQIPAWLCEPVFTGKSYTEYGCGPALFAHFCGTAANDSSTLIYAKVFNKTNNTTRDYYLKPYKKSINIGHGMCSGAFTFEENSQYEVQFGLMDASGHESTQLTNSIAFTSPTHHAPSDKAETCNCNPLVSKHINRSNYLLYALFGASLAGVGILLYNIKKA